MRVWIPIVVLAALAAAPLQAAVGGGPDDIAPSVDELIAIALAHAPEIPVLEAKKRASHEREESADALPDPMLGLTAQGMGLTPPGPASSIVVDVSQELPFPGKRAARRAATEAETNVRAAEVGDQKRRIAAQVRILYARIYGLDQERQKRISTRDILDLLSRTLAARYSTGQVDRTGLLRIQLESARVDERMIELEGDRAELVASLNRLLGRAANTPLGRIPSLPPAGPLGDGLDASALGASSELEVLRAEAAAAEKRVDETRLEEKPDFSIGLGGGVDGMAEPVVMLRFGVGLPLWRGKKQVPLTRAAEQDLAAAKGEIRATEADVRTRVAALKAAWRRDEALIALYTDTIIPQSRAMFEAAQAAYLADRGDFSSVIEGYEALLDSEVEVARREAARFETWALLEQLVKP